jgi:phosphatidylglycerophosphate synthase
VTAHDSTEGAIATPAPPPAAPPGSAEAVLVATAAFEDGPTAELRLHGQTLLDRLRGHLASLGVGVVHVIARPGQLRELGRGAIRHESADPAEDLRVVAGIARGGAGTLVVALGDLVAHREALAGLLADPRLDTAVLAAPPHGRPFAPRIRLGRARVLSAGSPYHRVHLADSRFLGALKVAPADRELLAAQADRLSALVAAPPPGWERTLEYKGDAWRRVLARRAAAAAGTPAPDTPSPPLSRADEAELRRRRAATAGDVTALLLVGLVRADVRVGVSQLRRLTCLRGLSADDVARGAEKLATVDEDRVLLDSAVKWNDGFFTTFFVSPYSKYLARWAARRGLTPNQVTTASVLLGAAAAVAFAFGDRAELVAGAILLQVAFTTDCVDGQLARYSRQFSKLGGWLDAVFDRAKEYAVYAGLALGSTRGGDNAWALAGAALTLQTFRHMLEFSYNATRQRTLGSTRQPPLEDSGDTRRAPRRAGAPGRRPAPPPHVRAIRAAQRVAGIPGAIWIRKMIGFPIGERFAAISLAAAFGSARLALTVVLAWGAVAAVYTVSGRVLRSLA